ncbi:Tim44 domain-containing protein [Ramlibacter albus]|uniref:Tim44 domain-containing protein n=1 Tax=Ramlibacter albus TaxID=2079448 RepID=A0A923S2G8_9BURK|nr:TIM44-like domain-containing protein [Ramlibacter albus]MBC5765365.1 Tim44 domain-containing protein [Ramlibacter albus]
MKIGSVFLALALVLSAVTDAEAARRLGGGGSVGKQSSNVTKREQSQSPAATPQQQAAPSQQARPNQPPPQQQPTPSRWGGILGGVAAGLGLAWLAHSLGFGAGFANFLMFALIAVVLFAVVAAVMRRRTQQPAYAGAAPADVAAAPKQYNPDKIGNDASARPWERSSMAFEPAKVAPPTGGGTGIRIGSALENAAGSWDIPAGFDTESFIAAAKRNFITLQEAWDRGDLGTLRSMMTDEMLAEIRKQLAERGSQPNHTEVVMLEAKLLGIEDLGDDYMASVEFSGMIREDASAGPSPFREVWNMTKPKDGSMGWLVAGLQALQ